MREVCLADPVFPAVPPLSEAYNNDGTAILFRHPYAETYPAPRPISVTVTFAGNVAAQPIASIAGPMTRSIAPGFPNDVDYKIGPYTFHFEGAALTYDAAGRVNGGTVGIFNFGQDGDFVRFKWTAGVDAAPFNAYLVSRSPQAILPTLMSGNDVVYGSSWYARYPENGTDTLSGYGGDDLIAGFGGPDALYGGAGNDAIFAYSPPTWSQTSLASGDGSSSTYMRGEEGDDTVVGGHGFDDINGNQGNDLLYGGFGADWVVGGQGNDWQFGNDGDDVVYGNLGNDTLDGGAGADWVRGGQGHDSLSGGAGDDFISGDMGNDTMSGGAGADRFRVAANTGQNRVVDFRVSDGDRVVVDPGTAYSYSQVSADVVISTAGGSGQMTLVGVTLSSLRAGWIYEGWI